MKNSSVAGYLSARRCKWTYGILSAVRAARLARHARLVSQASHRNPHAFYSSEAKALRSMLSTAFGFESVDAGAGWLIFLCHRRHWPMHPGEGPTFESRMRHEISFMCDDIHRRVSVREEAGDGLMPR